MEYKTLVVSDGNCGDYANEYRMWLEENLPKHIALEWRENTSGVGDGMFDGNWNQIVGEASEWWEKFCTS